MFDVNDRVSTPKGNGRIAWRRMAGPDYSTVQVYSVILDAELFASKLPPFKNYSGTTFLADDVRAEEFGNESDEQCPDCGTQQS